VSGLALLCPGQGGQHPGMFDFALAAGSGRPVLEAARQVLGEDPVALARSGSPRTFENAVAQPLVCAATLAAWGALLGRLPAPLAVAGYSVGELSAWACAGGLDPAQVIALAAQRAAAMDAATSQPAGLLALRGLPLARLEALAAKAGAEIAIVNGPDHVVAGGSAVALEALAAAAASAGATTVQRLPIEVAAHTSALAGAVAPFAAALAASGLHDPAVPVLSGTTGEPLRSRAAGLEALSSQLARRLEWARGLAAAAELGCTVFLELGPGQALARMAEELVPGAASRSVADFRSVEGVVGWVEARLAGR
jgi:[acyl-carrier-protein] S-malonyltransferase